MAEQVLVDGIHKDTGKPYEWRGGRPGKEVPWNGLPEINEEQATPWLMLRSAC